MRCYAISANDTSTHVDFIIVLPLSVVTYIHKIHCRMTTACTASCRFHCIITILITVASVIITAVRISLIPVMAMIAMLK